MDPNNTNQNNTNPINININKNENENQKNPYDTLKYYIIINNIEFEKEFKSCIETIKILEATICEKETEEDKYDNRVRYMKGLIQN